MCPRMGGYVPADHSERHEDGGRDEISLASLSGTPATLTTHEAALDAHHTALFEKSYIGIGYFPFPLRGNGTKVLVADTLYGMIIVVQRTITFSDIWVDIIAEAGQKIRLGLYNADSDLKPSTLIKDYGEITLSAAQTESIAFDQQLAPGCYFTAVVSDGTPTLVWLYLGASPLGQQLSHGNFQLSYNGFYGSHTYAALPATFPSATIDYTIPAILLEPKTLD